MREEEVVDEEEEGGSRFGEGEEIGEGEGVMKRRRRCCGGREPIEGGRVDVDERVGSGYGEDGGGRERRTLAAEGDDGGWITLNHGCRQVE